MINPIRNGRVLFSGPIIKHAHVIGGSEEAYLTLEVYSHGREAYIARVYLVVHSDNKEERYIIASASDLFKFPYEVYRYPKRKVAIARLHKAPEVELHHLHIPHDLIRFAYWEDEGKPKRKFDVRFNRINKIIPKENLEVEVDIIKSAFVGRYEKVRLQYDPEKNVVYAKEKEDDVWLIERKTSEDIDIFVKESPPYLG